MTQPNGTVDNGILTRLIYVYLRFYLCDEILDLPLANVVFDKNVLTHTSQVQLEP